MGWIRWVEDAGRSVAGALVLGPLLFLVSAGGIVHRLCGASVAQVSWAYRLFGGTFVWIAAARLSVQGAEHLVSGQPYVVVANHESNIDPFVLSEGLPSLMIRFIVKSQLMQVPVFGRALASTGSAWVERRQAAGDVRRMQETVANRDPSVSLLFFAEGTRSKDGRLQPFKKGAFATAIAAGLPILPVGIAGSFFVLQPGRWWLRRGPVCVEVGEPILVRDWADREALREQTFGVVRALRAQARARLRAAGSEPGGRDD